MEEREQGEREVERVEKGVREGGREKERLLVIPLKVQQRKWSWVTSHAVVEY